MLPRRLAGPIMALAAFFAAVEDMPIMPGLTEAPEASTLFDKPEGRIVQLVAAGQVDRERVLAFYAEALPQLGWRRTAEGNWRREEELLRLEVRPRGRDSELRIQIAPARSR
jgi:hypothetical protein